MAESAPRGTLGTVHNASVILQELSTGPAHQQLTDLAERSGMPVPTVHRLLQSLAAAGLVEQDPRSSRYGLGPELVRLSERYRARLPVLRLTGPYLAELRNATGGTVLVAILVGAEVITVDRLDGEEAGGVFRDANRIRPATDTAAGRVLLGHLEGPAWDAVATELGGAAPTPDERAAWRGQYVLLAADGPADQPEIAAPMVDGDDTVAAALAVTGGPERFSEEQLREEVAPHLLRAATAISRSLGHD